MRADVPVLGPESRLEDLVVFWALEYQSAEFLGFGEDGGEVAFWCSQYVSGLCLEVLGLGVVVCWWLCVHKESEASQGAEESLEMGEIMGGFCHDFWILFDIGVVVRVQLICSCSVLAEEAVRDVDQC